MHRGFNLFSEGGYLRDFRDARFNQDSSCLAVTCSYGFRVYNCNPFSLATERDLTGYGYGSVGLVEMLYRCNIVAIVVEDLPDISPGDSLNADTSPCFGRNRLILWDDKSGSEVARLGFESRIINVKLLRHLLVIVLKDKVHIYQVNTLRLLDTFSTFSNAKGICSVSGNDTLSVIAFPGILPGSVVVRVYNLDLISDTMVSEDSVFIRAHKSEITTVGLSSDGLLLVTSSTGGRLIRLWSSFSGMKLQEFRKAGGGGILRICHLSPDCRFLCTISITNVVSVYHIKLRENGKRFCVDCFGANGADTDKSSSGCLPYIFFRRTRHYLEAPTAYTRFRSSVSVVTSTFLPNTNNLLLVLANGRVHRLSVSGYFKFLANHCL
ncbi:uncharacterized protein BBOV_IV003010 [Babesia bovis T2Bo]|uniref:WD domain, G-beta repeat containing protein n=1 Tax=Babesia bovis TaxID=5865 RepID=A7AVS2_BABBO|nr:uncharacterized protein BBOV_IV003010 [Babesia bovis T2Bo]EDO05898.1 hypothetical protein BBOV_IV003010 [Babesia bovis T2Bo]|eukprot:XP_001609466.1 hypothetical protein [Babesia bovis T2Bo]